MVYLFITALLWGISFGFTKHLLSSVEAPHIIIIRLFFALLLFLPFLRFNLFSKKITLRLLGIGMIQQGAAYIFYIEALKRVPSYEIPFFLVFIPIYVALLFDLYQKKCHFGILILATFTILGSAIIYPPSIWQPESLAGFALMQLCNICFALGQVEYKHLQSKLSNIEERYFFPHMYLGALLLTLAIFGSKGNAFNISYISYQNYFYLFLLGTISSGLGFFLWNKGITKVRNSMVVLMNNLKIPISVFFSIFIFGEAASISHLIIGSSFFIIAFLFERIIPIYSSLSKPVPPSTLPSKSN